MIARGRAGRSSQIRDILNNFGDLPLRFDLPLGRAYDQAIRILGWLLSRTVHPGRREQRGIMQIRRVLTFAVALAVAGTASPALVRAEQPEQRNASRKRAASRNSRTSTRWSSSSTRVSAGTQPAPADIPLTWESNHFVEGRRHDLRPVHAEVDRSKLAAPGVGDVRARRQQGRRGGAGRPAGDNNDRNRNDKPHARVDVPVGQRPLPRGARDGKVSRAIALKPGDYEVFIAIKERTPEQAADATRRRRRSACCATS